MDKKHQNQDEQLVLFPEPVKKMHPFESAHTMKNVEKMMSEGVRNFSSKEEYYRSGEWRWKRYQKFEQVGRKCEKCDSTTRLEVHHKTYDRLYNERLDDLKVLCSKCHYYADRDREDDNAYHTYVRKVHGEGISDPSIYADEFEEWMRHKAVEAW